PIHVSELLAILEGTSFIARGALDSYKNIVITKTYIEKAFKYQLEGKGFSFVEMLSPCPTDWGMSPQEALKWLRENMMNEFKLGVIKDKWSNV
ncbi:MAG: 2-oxoglutarate oxidoreductase, partial [Thermodesulfovibrio sp.]|nr:2-oxoglutarate oxidoreductase [Thermodesulfovibrio sp.]